MVKAGLRESVITTVELEDNFVSDICVQSARRKHGLVITNGNVVKNLVMIVPQVESNILIDAS
ncbi:hypothetical protein PHISCL_08659 [Aspergillus sclerotialis]|uniref:Uncharacterized protein n=1 Tax=Aspergillus sclerotialis TaxID=2070753 RepID=A0A3A2ZCG6_9EURO|nr:hypothetical protein PHISCL_08659 [Aspergillus sclerotialis]